MRADDGGNRRIVWLAEEQKFLRKGAGSRDTLFYGTRSMEERDRSMKTTVIIPNYNGKHFLEKMSGKPDQKHGMCVYHYGGQRFD